MLAGQAFDSSSAALAIAVLSAIELGLLLRIGPYRFFDPLARPLGCAAHGAAVGKRTARSGCSVAALSRAFCSSVSDA